MPKSLKLPTTYALALSADGGRLAALGRNVVIADTVSMKRIISCHPVSHPSDASFSPDGKHLAVKSTSGQIVVIGVQDGKIIGNFNNSKDGEGGGPSFSTCGTYLIDGSWAGHIYVRRVSDGLVENSMFFPGEMIKTISFSSKGDKWIVVHAPKVQDDENLPASCYMTVWDWPLKEGNCKKIYVGLDTIYSAAISPQGHLIAIYGRSFASGKTLVQIHDLAGDVKAATIVDGYMCLRWSPDGSLIGIVQKGAITIHAANDLALLQRFDLLYASDVVFAPDLSFIALGSWNGGIVKPFGAFV